MLKELNVIPEPINVLEKYLKKKLHDVGLGDDFLDVTLKAQATETEINTWDLGPSIQLETLIHFVTFTAISRRKQAGVSECRTKLS